jgi:hypothetical protein
MVEKAFETYRPEMGPKMMREHSHLWLCGLVDRIIGYRY